MDGRGSTGMLSLAGAAILVSASVDLSGVYPATLDFVDEEEAEPLEFECEQGDVWSLTSFRFDAGDQLELRIGPAQLVVGRHEGNALWAVVFPERAAKIQSDLAGDGEQIHHVWLRFHPARIGELFPARTVRGPGREGMHVWGHRVYNRKIWRVWSKFGLPIVPRRNALIVDIDTVDGVRRHFSVDLDTQRVEYKTNYVAQGLPAPQAISRRDAADVIDAAWLAIDTRYPYLGEKKDLGWQELRKDFKKRATQCEDRFDAAVAVRGLLEQLGDDGVWVRYKDELLPGFGRGDFTINASWAGVNNILGSIRHGKHAISWAKTPHDIGYISLRSAASLGSVEEFEHALEELERTWALIVDLRYTRNGRSELAQRMVGRFLPEAVVYASSRARIGGVGYELGASEERKLEPSGPWRYQAPVYVLIGQGTIGPGEELALMLLQAPGAIAMGSPSAGMGLSVDWVDFHTGYGIFMPTAVDFDAKGERLYGRGIQPDRTIEAEEEEFDEENDPVLYQVLEEILKTPAEGRRPGHADEPEPPTEEG